MKKVLISKRILFKKTTIKYGKDEFSKIKECICNIFIEAVNIPHFLENKPRLIFFYEMKFFGLLSNRLIFEVFSEKRKSNLNNKIF